MATVIAFTSGKRDVGKSTITINLALSLAARNTQVCLLDSVTNIQKLAGITPRHTIEHVLNGEKNIDDIVIDFPSGISIVPMLTGIKDYQDFNENELAFLNAAFKKLEQRFDYIFIDTITSINTNVLDLVASAHYRVLVITSEPNSLTDCFALLKMLIVRAKKQSNFVLVNRVSDYQTSQVVFNRFKQAVKTYLNIDLQFLGYLPADISIEQAASQQRSVVKSHPDSAISCGFASLADVVKIKLRNDGRTNYFSQCWQKQTQHLLKKPKLQGHSSSIEEQHKLFNGNKLSGFFELLDQQQLAENELKELVLTLETIYEKKYKQSLKDLNCIVALILAEGNAGRIKDLYNAIERSYERQFAKKISNPILAIQDLLNDELLSKKHFNRLLVNFTDIYHKRFKEKYFSQGNEILNQIQQLLAKSNSERKF